MKYRLYSYRFAGEILDHEAYSPIKSQLIEVVENTPLPVFPGKSANPRLDVVQQVMNTYFDYEFRHVRGWDYHPSATTIPDSGLRADFRTTYRPGGRGFELLTVQVEVQLGNMARRYSDVFKFQTSYSQGVIDLGICIVPVHHLAVRIDSNITQFERVVRELPHAKLSITLPILVIGLEPDEETATYDLRQANLSPRGRGAASAFTNRGTTANRYRILHAIRTGLPLSEVADDSETGVDVADILEPTEEE